MQINTFTVSNVWEMPSGNFLNVLLYVIVYNEALYYTVSGF